MKLNKIALCNKRDMLNVRISWPANIKILSCNELSTNFNATLNGNRKNFKLKSADFLEDRNANKKLF